MILFGKEETKIKKGDFNTLDRLDDTLENLHKKGLDIDALRAATASTDPDIARKADIQLNAHWQLQPEMDPERAPTHDLLGILDCFYKSEREYLIRSLSGLQLTRGCNGGCHFCLFGRKKGVEAKFEFGSIQRFLEKYGGSINNYTGLYWDSDPLDYRDGEHSFVDVYRLWKEVKPDCPPYISTTIPKGSAQAFEDLITYTIKEYTEGEPLPEKGLRISLAKHNVQRIEAIFRKLTEKLIALGYKKKDINNFYEHYINVTNRYENISPLGALIGRADDIRDIVSPACMDGVVIEPGGQKSVRAIMMTIPTIYEPSGETSIPIYPGTIPHRVPARVAITSYRGFIDEHDMTRRIHEGRILLPPIKNLFGGEYILDDPMDTFALQLGRETLAVGSLIRDLHAIPYIKCVAKRPLDEKQRFINKAASEFRLREIETRKIIDKAKQYLKDNELTPEQQEKLRYYILITEVYLTEMDFIADQVEAGKNLALITTLAGMFRKVGRDQVDKLPQLMEGIAMAADQIKNLPDHEVSRPKVQGILMEVLREPFGLSGINTFKLPDWVNKLVDTFLMERGSYQ
jgi:hypothetical protein